MSFCSYNNHFARFDCKITVNYACYGIASVEFISRPWPKEELTHNQKSLARSKAPFEEKESYRWLDSIKKALPRCSNITAKTVIADREADIYPLLTGLTEELGVDYVIRSRIDPIIYYPAAKLFG